MHARLQKELEELKQQVRILQALSGYAADDAPGGGAAPSPAAPQTLEAALSAKARRLEHQQTMLRLQLAEAQGGCAATHSSSGSSSSRPPPPPVPPPPPTQPSCRSTPLLRCRGGPGGGGAGG